jgi:putative sigma-54 modulation protein
MEHSQQLKDYGIDKLSKLEKYLDSVLDAEITFTVEKFRHKALVVLSSNGLKITAEQESDDMYSAMDLVVDKLEKQIKRHREKLRNRGKNNGPMSIKDFPIEDKEEYYRGEPGNGRGGGAFLSSQTLDLPLVEMDAQEAVDKISQSSLPYLLYIDKSDGGIKLLRHIGGGSLELARFHRQAD